MLDRHPAVFKNELGHIKNMKAKIYVDADAKPRFFRARPVPYALRQGIEVIEQVQFSEWAAPVVPVLKKDNSMRLCGDYKVTINQVAKTDTYPLPRIDDLFASLAGGTCFSKLDLAHAYHQIPLDEASKKYATINTYKGLYRYNRLPFGISSAPSIFQRTIESILQDTAGVAVYIDDILITKKDDAEHLHNSDKVLSKLEEAGVRLKKDKCFFQLP